MAEYELPKWPSPYVFFLIVFRPNVFRRKGTETQKTGFVSFFAAKEEEEEIIFKAGGDRLKRNLFKKKFFVSYA